MTRTMHTAGMVLVAISLASCTSSDRHAHPSKIPDGSPEALRPITYSVLRAYGQLDDPGSPAMYGTFYRESKQLGSAYLLAKPDVIVYSSGGCDNRYVTPRHGAIITSRLIKWNVGYNNGGGLDCDRVHLIFIKVSRPLFDMAQPVRTVVRMVPAGIYGHHVDHGYARPAPVMARWAISRDASASALSASPSSGG